MKLCVIPKQLLRYNEIPIFPVKYIYDPKHTLKVLIKSAVYTSIIIFKL